MRTRIVSIPDFTPSSYERDSYEYDFISLADDNEFIPVQCLTKGDMYIVNGKKTFMYSLLQPCSNSGYYNKKRVTDFCANLLPLRNFGWIGIQTAAITKKYVSHLGTIIHYDDEFNSFPLMLLCVKHKYLFNIDRKTPDETQFCLVIDRSFIDNPDHHLLFRNVNKNYLPLVNESKVDIVYTHNIMDLCFNTTSLSDLKFDTVDKMLTDFKGVNKLLIEELKKDEPNGRLRV